MESKEISKPNGISNRANLLVSNFLVLAGSFQQAKDYFRARNIRFNPRRVVYNEESLYGRSGYTLICTGTYYTRKDSDRIEFVAKSLNYKVIFDDY